ncbi:hypothetical protein [Mucilaginibacter phyllosphaerae]|uniref:Uncharacterized protein n=1 Tax=Mucilaginibacter phyllosphaerae TaxID=1812349 RepID=A0A4Y8AD16_9SPHI|nr:hypothetical protein [Mucilaginibacter phyllosphaerae]MBB3969387.1 hypothetical protein [Mucilaginibacter phyllosphaerae]TEW65826.1 hypothetical protein E2R65_11855 [Mucilaginibacter phyllosphaerae]GGH08136.1 hypothetical protein GCM10007352_13170 [Mucilaginibacter phyllosphaerae]
MKKTIDVIIFSIPHSDSLYRYTCAELPLLGENIEIERGRTFFTITETFLLPVEKDDYKAAYILCGTLIGKHLSAANFKNLKYRIHGTADIDIELHSYGNIVFPASLD